MSKFVPVRIAVLTVSDTRTAADDRSGDTLAALVGNAGHVLADRAIVRDEVAAICGVLRRWVADAGVDCAVTTGGTGVTGRDVTPEALAELGGKDIPGFGELFRMRSYATIGTAMMQSRACARVVDGTYVFALPGSTGAVRDGWAVIAPQLDSRTAPCNFVALMPRLREG